jgi:hypothetical protein
VYGRVYVNIYTERGHDANLPLAKQVAEIAVGRIL